MSDISGDVYARREIVIARMPSSPRLAVVKISFLSPTADRIQVRRWKGRMIAWGKVTIIDKASVIARVPLERCTDEGLAEITRACADFIRAIGGE